VQDESGKPTTSQRSLHNKRRFVEAVGASVDGITKGKRASICGCCTA
jgi:hypothetical protein